MSMVGEISSGTKKERKQLLFSIVIFLFIYLFVYFKGCNGKLMMELKAVRGSGHDTQHVNSITSCLMENQVVTVNGEVDS